MGKTKIHKSEHTAEEVERALDNALSPAVNEVLVETDSEEVWISSGFNDGTTKDEKIPIATEKNVGLMSKEDKKKIASLEDSFDALKKDVKNISDTQEFSLFLPGSDSEDAKACSDFSNEIIGGLYVDCKYSEYAKLSYNSKGDYFSLRIPMPYVYLRLPVHLDGKLYSYSNNGVTVQIWMRKKKPKEPSVFVFVDSKLTRLCFSKTAKISIDAINAIDGVAEKKCTYFNEDLHLNDWVFLDDYSKYNFEKISCYSFDELLFRLGCKKIAFSEDIEFENIEGSVTEVPWQKLNINGHPVSDNIKDFVRDTLIGKLCCVNGLNYYISSCTNTSISFEYYMYYWNTTDYAVGLDYTSTVAKTGEEIIMPVEPVKYRDFAVFKVGNFGDYDSAEDFISGSRQLVDSFGSGGKFVFVTPSSYETYKKIGLDGMIKIEDELTRLYGNRIINGRKLTLKLCESVYRVSGNDSTLVAQGIVPSYVFSRDSINTLINQTIYYTLLMLGYKNIS